MAAATIASTTLAAAIDGATNRVTLAAGNSAVRGWIIVCEGENMLIQGSVAGSTTVFQVLRGWDGSAAVPHAAAAVALVGPRSYFWAGFDRTGACDVNKELALPSVNAYNGNQFTNNAGTWQQSSLGGVHAALA
jgi:hypothetical protein